MGGLEIGQRGCRVAAFLLDPAAGGVGGGVVRVFFDGLVEQGFCGVEIAFCGVGFVLFQIGDAARRQRVRVLGVEGYGAAEGLDRLVGFFGAGKGPAVFVMDFRVVGLEFQRPFQVGQGQVELAAFDIGGAPGVPGIGNRRAPGDDLVIIRDGFFIQVFLQIGVAAPFSADRRSRARNRPGHRWGRVRGRG